LLQPTNVAVLLKVRLIDNALSSLPFSEQPAALTHFLVILHQIYCQRNLVTAVTSHFVLKIEVFYFWPWRF